MGQHNHPDDQRRGTVYGAPPHRRRVWPVVLAVVGVALLAAIVGGAVMVALGTDSGCGG